MTIRGAGTLLTLLLVGTAMGVPVAARAEDCGCPTPEDTTGVVWQGRQVISLRAIAELLAPVISLSPDEPLLHGGPLPAPHPCDAPSSGAVVYYQVNSLVKRDADVEVQGEADSLFFDKVAFMRLRFFFYYPQDIGAHGHKHDVEGAGMEVLLEHDPGGCRRVRLHRVLAFAHGLPLYNNRLLVTPDTRLPITLMVEEGKHASCPDRNADGIYTPGYDVNERINDAWGVRDVFGSGRLLGGGYRAAMTKPRHRADRILPPEPTSAGCGFGTRSIDSSSPSRGRYELRSGGNLAPCSGLGTPAESTFFVAGMMVANRFGSSHPMTQHRSKRGAEMSSLDDPERLLPGLSLRFDEGNVLLSAAMLGIDLQEGWLVPRLGLGKTLSAELLFTPSATAWTSPYLSSGWENREEASDAADGTTSRRNVMATELGIKFRLALPEGPVRWLVLGYRFGGVRLAARFNGFERIENLRLNVAIGAGVF